MSRSRFILFLSITLLVSVCSQAAQKSASEPLPQVSQKEAAPDTALPAEPAPDAEAPASVRTDLNLLGKTDSSAGESRRNENVQFNLIDNNALKDLNLRLGATATIIREFEADERYFGSEFGNPPGKPIHQSLTSGSGFHGRLHYGHLNSATTARSFFQVGEVQPARENDYGFNFTVPLGKTTDLTVNGGQTKIRGQVNGNVLIPLPHERVPLAPDPDVAAEVSRIISAYPDVLPNRQDIAERMLNTNSAQQIDNDVLGGRLDQRIKDKDNLMLRYDFLTQKVVAFQFVKGQNPDMQTKSHLARATWARTWSPNVISDVSAGFQRVGSLLTPEENFIGMRVSTSSILEGLGPGNSIPIDRARNDYQWAAKFTVVRGQHQLYFGTGGFRRQLNGEESDAHIGHFSFNNNFGADAMTNLRLGRPSGYFRGIGYIHRGFRNTYVHGFAGDHWKVKPNLSLSIGVRWEGQSTPAEVNGLNSYPYNGDWNNFAPSFAFAYSLKDGWGVLRGAYGLHYGEIFSVTSQQIRFNAPLNYKLVVQNPDLLDPLKEIGETPPEGTRSVLYDFAPDLVAPYSHQYNFSWEFPVGEVLQVQLGYVGSRSPKLLHHWFLNRAHPVDGIPLTTGTVDERRANSQYTDIRRVVNGSRGYFDAAKATVILPRSAGFSGEVSYWFSKAIDLGTSYTNTAHGEDSFRQRGQYEYDVHGDTKGLSRFDQPHSFLARGGYELPYSGHRGWRGAVLDDWSVSGVVLLKTGTPFSLSTGSDSPNFGNVDGTRADRPNVVDPGVLGRTIGHPDESLSLLPREAFAFVIPGSRRGNIGRNTFRRGRISNINLSLAKSWRLQAERELTLRAESINFFNTPQFAEPGTSLTDSNFARITNTLNEGRTFRFLLRFAF